MTRSLQNIVIMILDIHTHTGAPEPDAVISCSLATLPDEGKYPGQLYSVGFHPWTLPSGIPGEEDWTLLEQALLRPDVVAVGECGIDIEKGGPLFQQMQVFTRQAELAEKVRKPLIVHCVKGYQHVIGVHKDISATVPWAIHGFRGKPTVAVMFLRAGFWLSFGAMFNPESLRLVNVDRILAETDESWLSIEEVIEGMELERGDKGLLRRIAANSRKFLSLQS